MRYNVSQLLKGHIGAARRYTLQSEIETLDPAIKPLSALNGAVELLRTNDGILARADFRVSVELTCSRCLTEFGLPVGFQIVEEFQPTVDILTGARLPQPDDADDATRIDSHHILDLTEIVRQSLTLALPMVPMCRHNCAGLCPLCGKNRNDGACECKRDTVDPRLAVLKHLLDATQHNT